MTNPRIITVHTFCSAKGGVGKSVLAIASAKILASSGRSPALLDCDFTGTSIADGLRLCAPRVVLAQDGSVDLDAAPTGQWLSQEETSQLRDARGRASWEDRPPPPPYLNDALTYQGSDPTRDCRVDAMVWHHEREDKVRYYPSSPLRRDVSIALGWIFRETPLEWLRRMVWLLHEMAVRFDDLTDVILDLPPGLWGFAHEASVLVSRIERGAPWPEGFPNLGESGVEWRANPILVVPPDRNGLYVSLEYL
ncbi:MAG: P-loop NTPase, partial [Myxococcota bacterium]